MALPTLKVYWRRKMNEWMLAFAMSLGMNAVFWVQIHNLRTDKKELLAENRRLWKSNNTFNQMVFKLRTELTREKGYAGVHGDRVSED
jgi:hypothetical protein